MLELGAGGGQSAAVACATGYAVTAIELNPGAADNARGLHPDLAVHQGDFLAADLGGARFDIVCYWDGFGVGEDADQKQLLRRIAGEWLAPDGVALVDIYTPWHALRTAGKGWAIDGRTRRTYGFDAAGCRWLDTWEREGEGEAVTQSLRCYSPADLRLLLAGTGLRLAGIHPLDEAPLVEAMSYTARLVAAG